MNWVKSFEMIWYMALFASLLLAIYFWITQGTFWFIRLCERRPSYLRKTNMLFVSNLKAKRRSHAIIIYLLTILLLGVFICTSVLYSSYYNVEENTEVLYPYSFQYTSLPSNTSEVEKEDISFIETTFDETGEYDSYYSAFKTDEENRIGFMSVSDYNALGLHRQISLKDNEYYVAAGNVHFFK